MPFALMDVVDDRFPVGSGSARQLGSYILPFIHRYTALGVAQCTRRVAIDSPPLATHAGRPTLQLDRRGEWC